MDEISPELALVDEELAAAARHRLSRPGDCLAPRLRLVVAAPVVVQEPRAVVEEQRAVVQEQPPAARRQLPSPVVVVATLFVAALVGSPVLDLLPKTGSAGPTLEPARVGVVPPATVTRPPTAPRRSPLSRLSWPPVSGVDFYYVTLWRDGERQVDLQPRGNTVLLSSSDPGAAGSRLEPGRYSWYVYPAFGDRGGVRYGKLLASGFVRLG